MTCRSACCATSTAPDGGQINTGSSRLLNALQRHRRLDYGRDTLASASVETTLDLSLGVVPTSIPTPARQLHAGTGDGRSEVPVYNDANWCDETSRRCTCISGRLDPLSAPRPAVLRPPDSAPYRFYRLRRSRRSARTGGNFVRQPKDTGPGFSPTPPVVPRPRPKDAVTTVQRSGCGS